MRSNGKVQKHYDKLTSEERFRLIVAAVKRGDDRERGALVRAAPRRHYSIPDSQPIMTAALEIEVYLHLSLISIAAQFWLTQYLVEARGDEERDEASAQRLAELRFSLPAQASEFLRTREAIAQFWEELGTEPPLGDDLGAWDSHVLDVTENWARLELDLAEAGLESAYEPQHTVEDIVSQIWETFNELRVR